MNDTIPGCGALADTNLTSQAHSKSERAPPDWVGASFPCHVSAPWREDFLSGPSPHQHHLMPTKRYFLRFREAQGWGPNRERRWASGALGGRWNCFGHHGNPGKSHQEVTPLSFQRSRTPSRALELRGPHYCSRNNSLPPTMPIYHFGWNGPSLSPTSILGITCLCILFSEKRAVNSGTP